MSNEQKCLIGIPCGSGYLSAYMVDGLFKLNRPIPTSLLIIERQSIDKARNYIVEMALKMNCDYLFFVDDDTVIPRDTLDLLLEDNKDIVCAPVMTRNMKDDGKHANCCFEKYDFYIGDGRTVNKYKSINKFPEGDLHQIDACGGACLLIKREVLKSLFNKYNGKPFEFREEILETKEHGITVRNISEDMTFSERAKQEGFEIWVDLRVRPVHLGKPKFIRFEQEGENLPAFSEPIKSSATLSEELDKR